MAKEHTTRVSGRHNPAVADAIERNIETMLDFREGEERHKSLQARIADGLTRFSGTMGFLYVHIVWFAWWIATNVGWLGRAIFDPFPFGLLTLVVSLEAIFLSTFVLISQNRAAAIANIRADLHLQIDLMAEHEVTQLLKMVQAIGTKIGVEESESSELAQLRQEVPLLEVIREIRRKAADKPDATTGTAA